MKLFLMKSFFIKIQKLVQKGVKYPENFLLAFVDDNTFKVYYSDVGIFNGLVNNVLLQKTIKFKGLQI